MNCPNCGGGLAPVGNRPYFRCPYCETFHFPEPLADGVTVVGGPVGGACPVCAAALTRATIDGHGVGYCEACRGFLADNATFNRVVQLKRARAGAEPPAEPFDRAELARRVNCPGCRKPMDAHPYHAGGNAVIDTCPRCRLVWLDAGELTVLGRYVPRRAPAALAPPRPDAPRPTFTLFGFPVTVGD